MYALGIDIGTTYTAAAVWRDGRAEIAPLGSHSAAIPSVVFVRSDGTFLTGESAGRRGLSEPGRVAREFKRRMGDPGPLLLGGTPYSAAALTARMLRSVFDAVSAREGGPPASICVAHPASWGPYKMDLMHQAVRLADLDRPVQFIADPMAAAIFHEHRQPLEPGAVVAVYDLGGGTFDAAVLRKTSAGLEMTGRPEGIDLLGGVDFDAKIFDHVAESAGGVDGNGPAVARLREECTQAKEALSADTETVIPVMLPGVNKEVRLTRSELEEMVRPALTESVEALVRAVRSAGYAPQALGSVLLMGGSSRMPIVAEMVGTELGRPVEVDADPKHAVALGAAWQASTATAGTAAPAPDSGHAVSAPPPGSAAVVPAPSGGVAPAAGVGQAAPAAPAGVGQAAPAAPAGVGQAAPAAPAGVGQAAPAAPADAGQAMSTPADSMPGSEEPTGDIPVVAPLASRPAAASRPPAVGRVPEPSTRFTASATVGAAGAANTAAVPPPPAQPARKAGRRVPAVIGAAVVVLLAAAGTAWALARPDGGEVGEGARSALGGPGSSTSAAAPSSRAAAPPVPADEMCTPAMKKSTRWVCLTKATLTGGTLTIWYDAEWNGTRPDIRKGFHLHIYGGDGAHPDESTMGSQAVEHSKYYFEDQEPSVRRTSDPDFEAVGDAKKVCARIAKSGHGLVKADDGSYHTGNCVPIQRS